MGTAAIEHRTQAGGKGLLEHLGDVSYIALKAHLLVDKSLGRIIAQHCRAASVLDDLRMNFYVKSKLARALAGDPEDTMLWGLIWRLYLIYTDVAHKMESPRVRQLIQALIEAKCEWKGQSLPAIANDDQLATSFRDAVETVLDALAAMDLQAQQNPARKGR